MRTVIFTLPMMYGDHHVLAVQQLLHDLPGIQDVYASSNFYMVEIEYDETQISEERIETALTDAGYTEEMVIPAEIGTMSAQENDKPFFRHTAVFPQTDSTISFGQNVPHVERPLWPCPGIDH